MKFGIGLAIMITFAAVKGHTAELPTQSYELFYISNSGSKLTATEALLGAVKGDQIFKCQAIEAKVSKTGTSIGLKNIKKPKKD